MRGTTAGPKSYKTTRTCEPTGIITLVAPLHNYNALASTKKTLLCLGVLNPAKPRKPVELRGFEPPNPRSPRTTPRQPSNRHISTFQPKLQDNRDNQSSCGESTPRTTPAQRRTVVNRESAAF